MELVASLSPEIAGWVITGIAEYGFRKIVVDDELLEKIRQRQSALTTSVKASLEEFADGIEWDNPYVQLFLRFDSTADVVAKVWRENVPKETILAEFTAQFAYDLDDDIERIEPLARSFFQLIVELHRRYLHEVIDKDPTAVALDALAHERSIDTRGTVEQSRDTILEEIRTLRDVDGIRHTIEQPNYLTSSENQIDIQELRRSIAQTGSLLRQHPGTFGSTDIHVERDVVAQITDWLLHSEDDKKNVAMLLDQAGMGKTVAIRDVLVQLDGQVDTLAIKADQQLTDIKNLSDIQDRLSLPDSAENILSHLSSKENRVVVLIDQIDALSLSLAHDQSTLNVVLDFVARIRELPNVRLLLSCRIFDRNSDPRLKKIKVEKQFKLDVLSEEVVDAVLTKLGIEPERLSPATRKLLRVPLHLDLFARVATTDVEIDRLRGIGSLQELYAGIWRNVIMKNEQGSPSKSSRIDLLNHITTYMNEHQRIFVPDEYIHSVETENLESTVRWLTSAGILLHGTRGVTFLHQTFFDYCYARRFVSAGGDVVAEILQSDQGIYERPKLLQIIAFLRGYDFPRYLRDLNRLLQSNRLRHHLRSVVLRWFGTLTNPTQDEWQLASQLFKHHSWKWLLLQSMYGNSEWFPYVSALAKELINSDDPSVVNSGLSYLASVRSTNSTEVVDIVLPFAQKNVEHQKLANFVLFEEPNWQIEVVQNYFEELIYKGDRIDRNQMWHLPKIAKVCPETAIRILRHVFDTALLDYTLNQMELRDSTDPLKRYRYSRPFDLLQDFEHDIPDLLKFLAGRAPEYFVSQMLPWCMVMVERRATSVRHSDFYQYDSLSHNWYADTFRLQLAFVHSLIDALASISNSSPQEWLTIANSLEKSDFATPHQLITHVYRKFPAKYSDHIFDYLTADRKRLDIGYSVEFDSRELIRSVVPHLNREQLHILEAKILDFKLPVPAYTSWLAPNRRAFLLDWLQTYGVEQYRLLHAMSPTYLSDIGKKRYHEWRRKFVNYEISSEPSTSRGGFVGSPIEAREVAKMSNASWLGAFQKYQHNVRHPDFLKGGAGELSSLLSDEVKNNPERFFKLFLEAPEELDDRYVTAFINGFAESPSTAEACFAVIRRFVNNSECRYKRAVARAVKKLSVGTTIPDDIFSLLYGWATSQMGEDEIRWIEDNDHNDASNKFLNSDRGAAFITVMQILSARDSEDARRTKWELIEYAVEDDSIILKVGAIEHLRYMIWQDRERAFDLYQQLLVDKDVMLLSQDVREFVWAIMYRRFKLVEPFIHHMLTHADESVRQRSAELIAIAFISDKALENEEARAKVAQLEEMVMGGDNVLRLGAARIYTINMRNADESETRLLCMEKVIILLDDPDTEILKQIDQVFFNLGENRFFELRPFMELYVLSNCGKERSRFSNYLWEHGMLNPEWSLEMIQMLFAAEYPPNTYWSDIDKLMRLVLRIYTSPVVNTQTKLLALDMFDELMAKFSAKANQLLDEWDRR